MQRKDISDVQVCEAVRQSIEDELRVPPFALLVEWTGCPVKVALAAVQRAVGRGLIDYGTSICWPFLSAAGRELIVVEGVESMRVNRIALEVADRQVLLGM